MDLIDCPTPDKKKFATRQAAEAWGSIAGIRLTPYQCQCGMLHLTMRPGPALTATDQQIEKLTSMTDEDFAHLVQNELRGKSTPEDAAALRSRDVVVRWDQALSKIYLDLEATLTAKKGRNDPNTKQWRASIVRRQGFIHARRLEIKNIKAQRKSLTPDFKSREERLTHLASAAAKRALAARHLDEYLELLDEERTSRGLPPQERYEKPDYRQEGTT